jgi:hypothetical protein
MINIGLYIILLYVSSDQYFRFEAVGGNMHSSWNILNDNEKIVEGEVPLLHEFKHYKPKK